MNDRPLVYLLFGIPGSGRRAILRDFFEDGLEKDAPILYFHPEDETASPEDAQIAALENVSIVQWRLDGSRVMHDKIEAAPDVVFFLAPGQADPADVVESVEAWITRNDCQTARLLTVVDCQFLKENPESLAWFDACIHFSDVVLLNHRDEAGIKWVRQFEEGYKKRHCPSRFLPVKNNRTTNPAEVLFPEARRTSLYFDELIPIEDDEFEEDAPDDLQPDRYIERLQSGQRASPIPSISKWLL